MKRKNSDEIQQQPKQMNLIKMFPFFTFHAQTESIKPNSKSKTFGTNIV